MVIVRSAGGFAGSHLSSVKPPFWFRCRLGELGQERENATFYLAPSLHCFSNSRWWPEQLIGIYTHPAKIHLHCRLEWLRMKEIDK